MIPLGAQLGGPLVLWEGHIVLFNSKRRSARREIVMVSDWNTSHIKLLRPTSDWKGFRLESFAAGYFAVRILSSQKVSSLKCFQSEDYPTAKCSNCFLGKLVGRIIF